MLLHREWTSKALSMLYTLFAVPRRLIAGRREKGEIC